MRASILSTGNELVRGALNDTNSLWLSSRLGEAGITVVLKSILDDDLDAISGAIRHAAGISDIVLVTGGLGPTPDDLTREAMASAMGSELELDQKCLDKISDYFESRGRTMSDTNRVQAMIPRGATALPNTKGTAPGIAARIGSASVYVMPGVPLEMKEMFTRCIEKDLMTGETVSLSETLKVYGTGESSLVELLGDLVTRDNNLFTGITVSEGLISIRITASGDNPDNVKTVLTERVDAIRDKISPYVISTGETSGIEHAVGKLLQSSGTTLATAESCTGGMIGEMITAVPGSSCYYFGGTIAYSNEVKINLLDVPSDLIQANGAVSEEVAAAMASGVRELFGSDWAVATTGIAGPSGGSDDKPVGLVYISLAGADVVDVNSCRFTGGRDTIRRRASLAALNQLRLKLL